MSDISLHLYGLIALLVAAGSSAFLLLGILICAILAATFARANGKGFRRQAAFAHLCGMALCLPAFAAVALFILANDSVSSRDAAKTWFDNYVLLWSALFLLPWLASVFLAKRRQQRK